MIIIFIYGDFGKDVLKFVSANKLVLAYTYAVLVRSQGGVF